MKPEEIEKIKQAVIYLKVARSSDYLTFHALVDGETFNENVIKPLEKLSQWNEDDEKLVKELVEKLKKEIEGKTLKEKSEKLKKILKIGRAAGLISIIGIAAYQIFKKDGADM